MTARRQEGIETRHARGCRSRDGGRCNCTPSYRAEAYDKTSGRKVRRTFPTLAAAKGWRADAQADIRRGKRLGPSGLTVRQAADQWLTQAKAGAARPRGRGVYKPSALRGYEAALDARILPALGGRMLEDVHRGDVQALVDRMLTEGRDPSTVRNTVVPLRVLYRWALQRDLVATNPTTGLEMPQDKGKEPRFASPEEAGALVAALDHPDRALWATALYAGLRAGELMALSWEHVDLAGGVIQVTRAWDPKARVYVHPKSKAGVRKVPVAAVLRDHLVEHKMRTPGEGLLWRARHGGPFNASTVATRARRAWAAGGLDPITLHGCRHTCASLMIAAGVNVKALSTYMGHANISITLDRYGHLMPDSAAEAAARLDAYLLRADTASRIAAVGA